MSKINDLEDLKKMREQEINKNNTILKSSTTQIMIEVGMCSIAAGVPETLKAVSKFIESEKLKDVKLILVGCVGLCAHEPILQVIQGEEPIITYGRVNAEVAKRIMSEHVRNGKIVKDHIIHSSIH